MAITVEDLYAGLLGRTPDAAGLQYWQSQFGSDVDANELQQFRQAAAAEIARQQQNAYAQELAAANVQRVAEPAMQTAVQGIRGVQQVAAERAPLEEINSLLAAPPTGSGEAGSEAYALNQQALLMDKFRIEARQAYDNPALFDSILAQIQESDLQADRKQTVTDLIRTDIARLNAATAENPNVTSGQYISNAARALDDAFGGVLGTNQANALSLDFRSPVELAEAIQAFQASNGRLLPEDALRVSRQYDAEDARNIGLALNTSSNSKGQEGLLGSTFGVNQAISRYNPQSNEFVPDQGGAKKDVFAAQFNAALNIGDRLPGTEGLSDVGEGFFTKKLGNPGAYDLFAVYYQDPNTGEAVQVGTSTNFNPELSGFKKFLNSTAGKILIGVGAGLLVPGVSSLLATGTFSAAGAGATLGSSILAGAGLGAASSAITGGDILMGALTGGAGGGIGFGIGQAGGLGNVLAGQGLLTDPSIISTLNKYVSGINPGLAGISDDVASEIFESQYRSLVQNIGQQAADEVFYGALAGTPVSSGAQAAVEAVADFAPTVNVTAPSVSPAIGAGLAGGAAAIPGLVAPTVPVVDTPIPAQRPPASGIPPVSIGTAPTVDVPETTVPPERQPSASVPPVNLGTAPTVDVPETPPTQRPSAPTPAPIIDVSQPVVNTPDTTIGEDLRNIREIAGEYITPALLIAGALNSTPVPTGVGNETLPAWVFDPAMSGAIPRIQAAQTAMPAPMPNLFNAQFRRGGLGAGQFIGYDLLNRTGDIPLETLLGVSPIATGREALLPIRRDENGITPLPYVPNLLGINYGQAPTSAPALV